MSDVVDPQVLVREFHEVFGHPVRNNPEIDTPERDLRLELIREEFEELQDAARANDLVEYADALADLVYVIYGDALTKGIDLSTVVTEVHRSNMSKLGEDGKPIYREDGKVLKGPGYFPPDIAGVIAKTFFDPSDPLV